MTGYTVNLNLRGQYKFQNPFTTNGMIQIGTGTLGNYMGGKLGEGFSSGSTALPFSRVPQVGFGYNFFGNLVGNAPQQAAQEMTEKKKNP